jgi:carboxylesterase type B
VQFARNGNPNGSGLPEWPAYKIDNRQVLEIGDEIVVHENLFDERMQLHIGRGLDLLDRATR